MAFQFRSNTIELDFDGVKFTINDLAGFSSKLKKDSANMEQLSETLSKDDPTAIDTIIDTMYKVFDDLLGAGASAKIFEGRERNVFDCYDVFGYILQEVEKLSNRINKYSPNRAARA